MNTMLVGKLAAIGTEVGSRTTIPDGRYKAFISGEGMPMRHLFHDPAPFAPFATLVIACNDLPSTTDRSTGFWARTVVIPFLNRFEGEAADTNLQDLFVPELPGIFNWAIEGYRRLRDRKWQFPEAVASRAATLQYREDTDSVLHWFSRSAVAAVPAVKVATSELFDHYVEHCRRLGLRADNAILFGKRLKRITDGHEGQPWSTVAEEGTPFSMSFHRDARTRGYVGNFRLVADR